MQFDIPIHLRLCDAVAFLLIKNIPLLKVNKHPGLCNVRIIPTLGFRFPFFSFQFAVTNMAYVLHKMAEVSFVNRPKVAEWEMNKPRYGLFTRALQLSQPSYLMNSQRKHADIYLNSYHLD